MEGNILKWLEVEYNNKSEETICTVKGLSVLGLLCFYSLSKKIVYKSST